MFLASPALLLGCPHEIMVFPSLLVCFCAPVGCVDRCAVDPAIIHLPAGIRQIVRLRDCIVICCFNAPVKYVSSFPHRYVSFLLH